MFLMDGAFGKNAELCFTVMVCPKKMRNYVFGQWCLRQKTRNSVFLDFQKRQKHMFFDTFCFWFCGTMFLGRWGRPKNCGTMFLGNGAPQKNAELCFWSMVPPKKLRNPVSAQWCRGKKCGILFLINGVSTETAESCFWSMVPRRCCPDPVHG